MTILRDKNRYITRYMQSFIALCKRGGMWSRMFVNGEVSIRDVLKKFAKYYTGIECDDYNQTIQIVRELLYAIYMYNIDLKLMKDLKDIHFLNVECIYFDHCEVDLQRSLVPLNIKQLTFINCQGWMNERQWLFINSLLNLEYLCIQDEKLLINFYKPSFIEHFRKVIKNIEDIVTSNYFLSIIVNVKYVLLPLIFYKTLWGRYLLRCSIIKNPDLNMSTDIINLNKGDDVKTCITIFLSLYPYFKNKCINLNLKQPIDMEIYKAICQGEIVYDNISIKNIQDAPYFKNIKIVTCEELDDQAYEWICKSIINKDEHLVNVNVSEQRFAKGIEMLINF